MLLSSYQPLFLFYLLSIACATIYQLPISLSLCLLPMMNALFFFLQTTLPSAFPSILLVEISHDKLQRIQKDNLFIYFV